MRRLLSLLLLACPLLAWAQSRTYQNPTLIPISGGSAGLVAGDWNGDGIQDLAYVDTGTTPSLHVLLGSSSGRLTIGQIVPLAKYSCSYINSTGCVVTKADLNHDGKMDILFPSSVGTDAGTVTALLGNGDGTFGAPIVSTITTNDFNPPEILTLMAVADFNGDGKPDVMVPDVYGTVIYMTGDGAGHFTRNTTAFSGQYLPGRPYETYAYDFNHDGKPDLLVLSQEGMYGTAAAQIFFNNGITFTSGPQYNTSSSNTIVADVNGDGIPDLLSPINTNLMALTGRSDGTFNLAQTVTAISASDDLLGAADLNNDGKPDIVLSCGAGLKVLPGLGNMAFDAPILSTTGNLALYNFAIGDFDGDGLNDVAAVTTGGIVYFHGNTTANFATAGILNAGQAITKAVAGDFNGDGRTDFVFSSSSGIQTYLNNGTGSLSAGPSLGITESQNGMVGDFDGDGKLDIAYYGSSLDILYGIGDGTFSATTSITVSLQTPKMADLNHDGRMDVVALSGPYSDSSFNSYYKTTSMLSSASSRTLTRVDTTLPYSYTSPVLLAAGDLNHDGFADIVLYLASLPGLQVMLGNGDGTFRAGPSMVLPSSFTSSVIQYGPPAITDMDGDGKPDLLLYNNATGISFLYGDGTGSFSAPVLPTNLPGSASWLVADVDHDGKPDLVFSDASSMHIAANLGSRNYSNAVTYVDGNLLNTVFLTDMNADGYPDIVAVDSGSAFFSGNSSYVTTALNIANLNPTVTLSVTLTPQTVNYNQGFTISTALTSSSSTAPAPTGSVQFAIDNQSIGSATISANAATFNVLDNVTQALTTGAHIVSATYNGDATYAASSNQAFLTTLQPVYGTSTTLSASSLTVQEGQFVTLTANVAASAAVNSGIVTFYSGQTILGQAALSNGVAVLQTNLLSPGINTMTATYNGVTIVSSYGIKPMVFQSSTSSAFTITVSAVATTTTLVPSSLSPSTGSVLTLTANVTSVPQAYGSVTFKDGNTILGTSSLSSSGVASFSIATLGAGPHNLTAAFNANDPFASSTSAASGITVHTINGISADVFFTSETPSGNATYLTIAVASPNGNASGTVTLLEDNQVAGFAQVAEDGTASFNVPQTSGGIHVFYASYSGNSIYTSTASARFLSTDYAVADFTLISPTAPLLTGTPLMVNMQAKGNWSGTVQFSCPDVPAQYVCTFSPASLTGSGATSLRLTPATTEALLHKTWLACALLMPLFWRRRKISTLIIMLFAIMTMAVAGCGQNSMAGQPSSIVTVQATSGTTVHSFQLEVH